jgi:hypothetical protein
MPSPLTSSQRVFFILNTEAQIRYQEKAIHSKTAKTAKTA